MQRRLALLAIVLSLQILAPAAGPPQLEPVTARIETTLTTAGGHIRQFAFDGDPATYFASAQKAGKSDHFALLLDQPVSIKSIIVLTGRSDGSDQLESGVLEGSADGKKFTELAKFVKGKASARPANFLRAVRVKPTTDLPHPLVVREFQIESSPTITVFRYPVEFIVTVEAPEMKEWTEKAARLCEKWYPRISEELRSDGFKPPTVVTMKMSNRYKGVAATSGDRITGSTAYFKSHPGDVGAMVHETVHVVQQYRARGNPGWLVEGIADYIRFFKYEPETPRRLRPNQARYDGSYRTTAAFLAYLTAHYDKDIVRKLNKAMREGEYHEAIFKKLTGKTIQKLGEEWKESLRR